MTQNYPEKLRDILRSLHPDLGEEKINELTDQFYEIGLFLIRLWLKQHPKPPETGRSEEFPEKPRGPPTK